MVTAQSLPPFALLRDIETRSQQKALGLPQQIEVRRTWSGIGFRVRDINLVVPTSEVTEIMQYPNLTRVPSTQQWVKGIANIRGTLLPIMDLGGFIDGTATKLQKKTRVLMITQGSLTCGLVVDEVLGLRHFFEEEKSDELPKASHNLKSYLAGAYKQADSQWGIFSMRNLAKNPQFLEVATRG